MAENNGGVGRESANRGTNMKTFFPRDNSSFSVPNAKGGKMGGSSTNLAHSLGGASATQKGAPGSDKDVTYRL